MEGNDAAKKSEREDTAPAPPAPAEGKKAAGGVVGNMKSVLPVDSMVEVIKDPEKRKHFFTHEDMDPHRHLAILLGATIVIALIVALASSLL
ncbi:MAG: hypothetical protein J7L61_03260 [Thermoplasmata archaeon]|nr:hypothetical protein [Thermoplasmata archaeon]